MNRRYEQKILTEIGSHDQYSTKYDVFILDGAIVRTPGKAKAQCRGAGLDPMETHVHLSRLIKDSAEA